MKQSEHVDCLMKLSRKRSELVENIQAAYGTYLSTDSDKDFEKLILLLDAYCVPWVRKKLWATGCYSDENEHTALQEARISVWKSILKDRTIGSNHDTFAYFAFDLYKKRTYDVMRKVFGMQKKLDTCSMEEAIGDDGKTLEETIRVEDTEHLNEMGQMYDELFRVYCEGFLTSKAFPPRILALYYARVLPHLLDSIPESKAASAKWAFERMGNSTMWELKEDSEKELQKNVWDNLHWCEEFICQMNEESDMGNTHCILKNMVYTAVYTKGKIEDWADSMHKTTVKAVMRLLPENKELYGQVVEHISQGDVLGCFIKGGKRK